jgi:uncharacterized iron-regulated membrane protein
LWIRKLFFQIHLWVGIGAGLYVAVISISGSAIVLRREIARQQSPKIVAVASAGRPRLPISDLQRLVQRAYPGVEILSIGEPENEDQPDQVVLENHGRRFLRFFDPYTGADLGDPQGTASRLLGWLTDLHDNLLSGLWGRILNGIGSLLLVLLTFAGAVIWWPGIKNWRRSTKVKWRARFARVNWDLHSAAGFWCYLFVLIWGVSGLLLCFPGAFDAIFNSQFRLWMTRLHFGRFNLVTEVLWTILGLAPALLAVTGALMWWNRVVRKKIANRRWNSARVEVDWQGKNRI